ncbi:PIN domain-containing protein [Kribbella sp. VKM Ac-2569]|uniref:PIN domain-containing protein n=1 Tax=Kribbella sp. VKM Ac-2569 TaxID=2512220 RepID=UPI00102C515E|nr:PIN domain-containing protein [Kribbella sp. VKM Ac-2569]RZT27164.1 PIN domain-containing protein [Kribbella sp. VKM Ac-2569]
MTEREGPESPNVERAFLDANVIRGQQTTDVLLSLANRRVFEPRWTQHVIDEMRRNRPPGLPEADIDRRIRTMNRAFPDAFTEAPPQGLQDRMRADSKDKHVLAGAVYSESEVLVTDNLKDFDPPSSGPDAMRVENLNQFLNRKLRENPDRVQGALRDMLSRYKRDPRTMPALIDAMAEGQELREFAQKLDTVVPIEQRGSSPVLAASQRGSAQYAAFEGMVEPGVPAAPSTAPEARKAGGKHGVEKAKGAEQDH